MTATFTKRALSGSTSGRGIKVVQTGTAGTTIHTSVSGTSDFDEIWIYAFNGHTSSLVLTLEWGGATVPDDNIVCTIPAAAGLQLVAPGLLLQNGCILKAFAGTANKIVLYGFVNRITA